MRPIVRKWNSPFNCNLFMVSRHQQCIRCWSEVGAPFAERQGGARHRAPGQVCRLGTPPPTPIITRDSPHKEDKHTIWRPARNAEIREILNFMKNYVLNIFWHNTQNTRNINRCRASGLICRSTISPLKHIHQLSHKRLNFTKIVILKILKIQQNTVNIDGFRKSGRMRKTTISPKHIHKLSHKTWI